MNYIDLVDSLHSSTVVTAFGRFNPPTAGHERLFKILQRISNDYDVKVFVSHTSDTNKNPLSSNSKLGYLKSFFKDVEFNCVPEVKDVLDVLRHLSGKYQNIVFVAGADRASHYQNLFDKYNHKEYVYNSIKVINAGERDSDDDVSATKAREAVAENSFEKFNALMPKSIPNVQKQKLFNELHSILTGVPVKSLFEFNRSQIREDYHQGKIFNAGSIIESEGIRYTVASKGSNYINVISQDGELTKKWITECVDTGEQSSIIVEDTINFYGYCPSNINKFPQLVEIFKHIGSDTFANIKTIHSLNEVLSMALGEVQQVDVNKYNKLHGDVRKWASSSGIFELLEPLWTSMTIKEDKIKKNSNYNAAKDIMKYDDFKKLMNIQKGDDDHMKRRKHMYRVHEDTEQASADYKLDKKGRKHAKHRIIFKNGESEAELDQKNEEYDLTDEELDAMVEAIETEFDILEAYDDDEFCIIDEETGEYISELEDDPDVDAEQLDEVLSRAERIKSKIRFARTSAKRNRKRELALKRRSDMKTASKRARRMATRMLKMRFSKKPVAKMSVAEKERVERILAKKKDLLSRLSVKMIPKIKKIESDRLRVSVDKS